MKKRTEITVLGFKGSSDFIWHTDTPEHITYMNYSDFLSQDIPSLPQSIAIHGHSNDTGRLEEKKPNEIANELGKKYPNKEQLREICLLGCTVSQPDKEQPSFAQSLANELYTIGFNQVIIHAPPKVPKGFSSRLLVHKGFRLDSLITYYVIPDNDIARFDQEENKDKPNLRDWDKEHKVIGSMPAFPDTFILNTDKYYTSEALLIKNNINNFFSNVWKELYVFFSFFGSSIQIESQEITRKHQELNESYAILMENENERKKLKSNSPTSRDRARNNFLFLEKSANYTNIIN